MSTPGSCLIHYEVSMKSYEVIPIQTISQYDSLIAQIRQLKQDIADLTAEKDDLEGRIRTAVWERIEEEAKIRVEMKVWQRSEQSSGIFRVRNMNLKVWKGEIWLPEEHLSIQ